MYDPLKHCDDVTEKVNASIAYVLRGEDGPLTSGQAEYLNELSGILKNFAKVKKYDSVEKHEHKGYAAKEAAHSHNPY